MRIPITAATPLVSLLESASAPGAAAAAVLGRTTLLVAAAAVPGM